MNDSVHVKCPTELQFLAPKIVEDLCRIGNRTDGGYAITISAINNSEAFLSLGLGENWSFEEAISTINLNAPIDIYDDTVSLSFFIRKAFNGLLKFSLFRESKSNFLARFLRLKAYISFWSRSSKNTHHQIRISAESFKRVLSEYPIDAKIGLKVDIEGSEWDILNLISESQSKFEFLLIEIHDFDRHVDELRKFLSDLAENFIIAHLHANNFETLGSNGFPKVFEITLLRATDILTSEEYRKELPIPGLDAPNAKNRPDFLIKFQ